MKYIPILMSTPMVQATLDYSKKMTRRVVKFPLKCPTHHISINDSDNPPILEWCKYQPVDVLWVRETYWAYGQWLKNGHTKKGKQKWKFKDLTGTDFQYQYFDNPPLRPLTGKSGNIGWYKRPSLFMPRKACRLFLKVTGIKVERLHDISPGDACAEGIRYWNVDFEMLEDGELVADYENYMWRDDEKYEDYHFPTYADPISSFMSLWEKINGAESLQSNPWVWVISFERMERPEGFLIN